MGQFALGIRSLLLKSIIFVILAALLAWTLGGRLWGPTRTDFKEQAASWNGDRWFWRMMVGGRDSRELKWNLMRQSADGKMVVAIESIPGNVAGPIAGRDGLYYASHDSLSGAAWQVVRMNLDHTTESWSLPDRLAVEQQLARVKAGLPVQNAETIMRQRDRVLDPKGDSTDEG